MASSSSRWESFFKEAGIPSKLAKDYAGTFSDNRMRLDMLDELSKELLIDLGIKAVGDVIAILRHAKLKHKEMARRHSPSPEVQITEQPLPKKPKPTQPSTVTNKPATKPVTKPKLQQTKTNNSTAATNTSRPLNGPSLRIQAPKDTSTISKPKEGRKKLSDRFDHIAQDLKRKKEEEEKEEEKEKAKKKREPQTPVKQATVFTVQMPSKNISSTKTPSSKTLPVTNQKVTLVPAQGKTLNRSKPPSSIFDRLEKTKQTKSSLPHMDENILKKKQTVFNRLGDKTEEPQKVQKVSAMLRLDTSTPSSTTTTTQKQLPESTRKPSTSNVFNRLGDR